MIYSQILFLSLLKSGLWDTPLGMNFGWMNADWNAIVDLAHNQTVVGFVMDGVVKLPNELRPNKGLFFKLLLNVNEIERKNESINIVTPKIMGILKDNNCEPLLLKGQGLAVFYKQPNHRMSGDIDLFVGFDDAEYKHCNEIIKPLASQIGQEKGERKHIDYTVMGETVEVHGSIKTTLSKRCDSNITDWAQQRLAGDNVIIKAAYGHLTTPPLNFNALYVFIHLVNHYMNGGVGLRHVCDWMMFLHNNYDKIDLNVLTQDIKRLGLQKFWMTFASAAVVYLDYPKDKMPLYDSAYDKRSETVMRHIFNTGNFGIRQKAWQTTHQYNKTIRKVITFFGQIPVYLDNFSIFPREAMYCFGKFLRDGVNDI